MHNYEGECIGRRFEKVFFFSYRTIIYSILSHKENGETFSVAYRVYCSSCQKAIRFGRENECVK